MDYGLEFYGANGQLLFDSRVVGDTLAIENGTITTVAANSTITWNLQEEFLFLRPSASTGNLRGNVTYSGTNNQNGSLVVQQATKYFKARKSSSATNIGTGTAYGLEVYNSSGTSTTFSTRSTVNAMNIVGTANPGYGSGNNLQGTWHNSVVYSGTTSDKYVSVIFMFFSSTYSDSVNSYIFNSTNITFDSAVTVAVLGGGGKAPLPLFGQSLISEIKS